MNPLIKAHILEIVQVFVGILIPLVVANLNTMDFTNLTKASLLSFGMSVVVQAVKGTWNHFFPNIQLAKAQYLASKAR
jgi:hypothetical protein